MICHAEYRYKNHVKNYLCFTIKQVYSVKEEWINNYMYNVAGYPVSYNIRKMACEYVSY